MKSMEKGTSQQWQSFRGFHHASGNESRSPQSRYVISVSHEGGSADNVDKGLSCSLIIGVSWYRPRHVFSRVLRSRANTHHEINVLAVRMPLKLQAQLIELPYPNVRLICTSCNETAAISRALDLVGSLGKLIVLYQLYPIELSIDRSGGLGGGLAFCTLV